MNAKQNSEWTIGQVVVVVGGRYHTNLELVKLGTVMHVTAKTVKVQGNMFGEDGVWGACVYRHDGQAKGARDYSFIRPLQREPHEVEGMDGTMVTVPAETVQSIIAANAAIRKAAQDEADQKEAAKQAAIEAWWNKTGRAMWDARIDFGIKFLGKQVYVIQYKRYHEEHMPFVIIEARKDYKGNDEFVLTVGGLIGREYKDDDKTTTSVSTFSCSNICAPTVKEALWNLCC